MKLPFTEIQNTSRGSGLGDSATRNLVWDINLKCLLDQVEMVNRKMHLEFKKIQMPCMNLSIISIQMIFNAMTLNKPTEKMR